MTKKKTEGGKEIVTESRCTDETILTKEQTEGYTVDRVFGDWHPDRLAKEIDKQAQKLKKRLK